jgi:diguanylate cyclase (GGDEF)-like protein
MRRNLLHLMANHKIREGQCDRGDSPRDHGDGITFSKHASMRDLAVMDRGKSSDGESLDEVLSAALLTQDKELAGILQEMDEISIALKSDASDKEALSNALHRTVLRALKQSLLDRELCSLALTDDLTRLYNRRAFLALAAQQLKVARRTSSGLLLFYADVDNLKIINDSYGHREGDLALVRTAEALEQTFRNSDVIARLGGDEFAVLALEASSRSQEVILNRLRESFRGPVQYDSPYRLSVSVGVARLDPKHRVSLGELMALADRAMYEEKRTHLKS